MQRPNTLYVVKRAVGAKLSKILFFARCYFCFESSFRKHGRHLLQNYQSERHSTSSWPEWMAFARPPTFHSAARNVCDEVQKSDALPDAIISLAISANILFFSAV